MRIIDIKWMQRLLLAAVIMLGLFGIITSGGGGGGDGDDVSDDPAPTLPAVVQYSMGGPGSGVTLEFEDGSNVSAVFQLLGSYTKAVRRYTLFGRPVPVIEVTPADLPFALLFDPFSVRLDDNLVWDYGTRPIAGSFVAPAGGNHIRITVNNDVGGSGQPGVNIGLIEFEVMTAFSSLQWDEFEAILDDSLSYQPYQVQAAYVYYVLRAVLEQVELGIDHFIFISQRDADLEAAGIGTPVIDVCDLLSFNGTQGDFRFTWFDGPGEIPGELGPGDNFTASFHNCWRDDPANSADTLFESGVINLNGYMEDQTTLALGFAEVDINDVVVKRTEEVAGIPTPSSAITVNSFGAGDNSGFAMFLEPDTSTTINLSNAISLAEAAITALTTPREVGDFALGQLLEIAEGGDPNDLCDAGGSVNYTLSPNSLPIATGHVLSVTFNGCVANPSGTDAVTYNGSYGLTVDSLTGSYTSTTDYDISARVSPLNVQTTDNVGSIVLTGGMRFSRSSSSGVFNEISEALPGTPLSMQEAGVTRSLSAFATSSSMTSGGAFMLGAPGESVTLSHSDYTFNFTVDVSQSIAGNNLLTPDTGNFALTAADGSVLTLDVAAGGVVTLDVDTDGDGNSDGSLVRDWDELY